MAKVKKLEVKNIMGVEEVNIQPRNELVIIAGGNAQGKTSVIKSLEIALRGKKAMSGITKMVHEGEEEGDIIADLGDIIIKRHYTDDGKERLKVARGADGTDITSPEGVLSRFINKMLKPVDFMKMNPKEQKSLLINSLDLDIDLPDLEKQRQEFYELRVVKGRDRDNAKAHLDKMEPPESWEDMPEEEISFGNLVQELEKRKDHNNRIEVANRDAQETESDIRGIESRVEEIKNQIEELKNQIVALEEKKKLKVAEHKTTDEWIENAEKMDEDEVREKIDKLEAENIRIREANKYRELYKNVEVLNGEYSGFTKSIGKIDKTIEASLSRAKMPIPGLEIYDDGLGVAGLPIKQIAESDQLKACIGISMGLEPQPELKVLIIENGRDLTEENWETVRVMAREHGYQIWIQYVDVTGEIGFVIQEGKIIKINE